jgi:hypothetical protein
MPELKLWHGDFNLAEIQIGIKKAQADVLWAFLLVSKMTISSFLF